MLGIKNVSFRVVGTNSADTIKGTLGQAVNEFLDGGAGDDRLLAYEGADVVAGGEGNDFHGNFGGDLVDGGAGNDTSGEVMVTMRSLVVQVVTGFGEGLVVILLMLEILIMRKIKYSYLLTLFKINLEILMV